MKIKVPQSLYDALDVELKKSPYRKKMPAGVSTCITIAGPYGPYDIVAVPDEKYTETVTEEVLRYRETEK